MKKFNTLLWTVTAVGIGLLAIGLDFPERLSLAKSRPLTPWEMGHVLGGASTGCEEYQDFTSCFSVVIMHPETVCNNTRTSEQRDQNDGESDEEYERYKDEHPLPSCDLQDGISGNGKTFDTARVKGTDGRNVVFVETVRCRSGYQCDGSEPEKGTKGGTNDEGKIACVLSSNPNKYCVKCSKGAYSLSPDSAQPVKNECKANE